MNRNKFNLSYYKLLTMNQGYLVPVGITEVIPGDTFKHSTSALIRVAPQLAPVMHPVKVKLHHWWVPNRLVWEEWEDFITGGPDGESEPTFPTISTGVSGFAEGSLADYFGIPPGVASKTVSALPFRAYNLIYNEYYADQDLNTPRTISLASGTDTTTTTTLASGCWQKDYFTTARTFTQKGPEVTIPLGTSAPVIGIGKGNTTYAGATANGVYESDGTTSNYSDYQLIANSSANDRFYVEKQTIGGVNYPNIRADLSNATAANIIELRQALAIQRFLEMNARGGSRYVEHLRNFYGVIASDGRLQRPVYLGGGKQTIQFSEVLQTAPTTDGDDTDGVGNMKGHGIGALRSNTYRHFFEEHGHVITLMQVQPVTMYIQGCNKMFLRRTKFDFFNPMLQHIGQQAISKNEVYFASATGDADFGYQDKYDEYRRSESNVAGEFRSTLDYWHMARKFSSEPTLNSDFVTSNPTDRIYASTTTDQLYVMVNHRITAKRTVAKLGTSSIK